MPLDQMAQSPKTTHFVGRPDQMAEPSQNTPRLTWVAIATPGWLTLGTQCIWGAFGRH
jgi:hypothetical protein